MHIFSLRSHTLPPMSSRPWTLLVILLVVVACFQLAFRPAPSASNVATATPAALATLAQQPLAFVPNQGQSDPLVRYQAQGMGGTLFFTSDEVVLALPGSTTNDRPAVVRLRFEGAQPEPHIDGVERQPGRVSFFRGDSASWRADLPTYAGINYGELYPGVGLRYDGLSGRLKGTYTVAPGADPTRIRWRYEGAERVAVDQSSGDLRIELAGAGQHLIEQAPVAWQEIGGANVPVTARYTVDDAGAIGFTLGAYDPARPLVIDPTLSYSTFLGGNAGDSITGIALDQVGNIYLTGATVSADFPGSRVGPSLAGQGDIFVAKLSVDGQTLLYSALLGGSSVDDVMSIAIGTGGQVFISGTTESPDFPTVNALQSDQGDRDGFVARLSADGARLEFSTYLGGSGIDWSYSIGVDGQNDVYVAGITASADFPQPAPTQPITTTSAFVTKLSGDGSALRYTTILRGGEAHDLAVDTAGNAYITGQAIGSFLSVKALQSCHAYNGDAFITKLLPSGGVAFSTCFGGADGDYGDAVAVDPSGNIYIGGQTFSYDFPLVNAFDRTLGAPTDAFVSKLSGDGQNIGYSTFIGGYGMDWGYDITVDSHGDAYLTGYTESLGFPLANQLPMPGDTNASCSTTPCDAFVVKLNSTGNALLFGTHLGGHSNTGAAGIALDGDAVYVAGWTQAGDFPTTRPLQPELNGGRDGFISKIDIPQTTLVNILLDDVTGLPIRDTRGTVALYAGTTFLDRAAFTTDAQGVYSVSFTGPISQSVRLEYSAVNEYAHQFYDRKPALGEATEVAVHTGTNALTTRLIPATILANTLLDDTTGLPIASARGTVTVYSGTMALETAPFVTDAGGSARIAFNSIINQPMRLRYTLDRYLDQYYDRKLSLNQADTVALHPGTTTLTSHLLLATRLVNTLVDDTTGQPIRGRSGAIEVYSGTLLLENRPFVTDASGVYTATLNTPINRDVYVGHRVDGYAHQYSDRKPTLDQADKVALRAGTNSLTTRLIPATTLINTLIDDATGQPIRNATGSVYAFIGSLPLDGVGFTTDATGVYTATFNALVDGSIALQHSGVSGYAQQFYDRKARVDQADRVNLHSGRNTLVTRLVPASILVNTLVDNATDRPIANAAGIVDVYLGASSVEQRWFQTNASGVYTMTLNAMTDQDVRLEYHGVGGYARQFYDRKLALNQSDPVSLRPGLNQLTSRLLPAPKLVNTLIDDASGLPVRNTSGTIGIYSGTLYLEGYNFTTDANGVLTTALSNTPVGQGVRLEYRNIGGYAHQYYDRQPTLVQASAVTIAAGETALTTRLAGATTLVTTLLDDATGNPIPKVTGVVEVYLGTTFLDSAAFTTDANGVATAALWNMVNSEVRLAYSVQGYPRQFYDRKPTLAQADPVSLHSGSNTLDARLQATTLVNTLLNDATGQPIPSTTGSVEIYSGTALLETLPFTTDGNGSFAVSLHSLLNQDVRLAYNVQGYPRQFYDRALELAQATPVRLNVGRTVLTTRLQSTTLVNTLVDDVTGLPIPALSGSVEIYSGTALLETHPFRTDASGVYTVVLGRLIDGDVRIGYATNGYPRQFYDRKAALADARWVRLTVGRTALSSRLLPPTVLNVMLLDDVTGEPVRNAYGEVNVYANTAQIQSAELWTDATGSFALELPGIVNQNVRIEYHFGGYANQFNNRKVSFETADPVAVTSGSNDVTTRLLRMPTLTNRLIDDVTGEPLTNRSGSIVVHWDGGWEEYEEFTTDADGVFTATFDSGYATYRTVPISQPVFIEYQMINGYLDQYYNRVLEPALATPMMLQSGANTLTTRLVPETVLSVTVLDNDTGEPLRNTQVRMGLGDVPLDAANGVFYTTDSNGQFVQRLGAMVGQNYRIALAVDGYPVQYHDRTTNFDRARQFALHPGSNTLTVQLAHVPRLAITLLDDATGESIRNTTGTVWIYGIPDWPSGSYWFNTDENGFFKIDLEGLLILGDYVRLRFEVNGYPRQFHNRAATFGQATPVLLHSGTNGLTIRLATEVEHSGTASGIVTPTSGGIVTNTVGLNTVALAFPPAAVSEPVTVTVTSQPSAPPPPGLRPLGDAFMVEARSQAGASVATFTRTFTLTVAYAGGDGLEERSLRVAFWDPSAGRWIDLSTEVDQAAKLLMVTTNRAGRFVVFGVPKGRVFLPVVAK